MKAWLRIPLKLATAGLLAAVLVIALLTGGYFYVEPSLPEAAALRDLRFQTPLKVYSRDGRLMQYFGEHKREPVAYDDIPQTVIDAFLAAEDARFFEHSGIDYAGILRGAIYFVTHPGERPPGGSTITQQVSRTTNLMSRDYSLVRKFKEAIFAFRIEREFTKKEILALFLNTTFFGQQADGIVTAARRYFDKELDELTLSEIAILAGIPQGPSIMNPYNGPERAAERRRYVLRRMRELNFITESQRQDALAEPIVPELYGLETDLEADYVAQMAYEWCQQKLDKPACDTAGLRITTTIDSRLQVAARKALRDALESYDHNHGYRGPIGHVDLDALDLDAVDIEAVDIEAGARGEAAEGPSRTAVLDTLLGDYPDELGTEAAVVVAVNDLYANVYLRSRGPISIALDAVGWARPYRSASVQGPAPKAVSDVLTRGDIVRLKRLDDARFELAQIPSMDDIQGALVSLDPKDGAIVALVGGYSFQQTQFNRATQARRQPGSAFKPFFYLSALNHGYTLASIIKDAPYTEYVAALEDRHMVENYDGKYHGDVRLRYALKESLNASADRVIRDIGASYAADYVERFGFSDLARPANASLALGSGVVTPVELASAYAILANGGHAVGIRPDQASRPAPYFIQRVEDADGNVLYNADDSVEMVCPEPEEPESGTTSEPSEGLIERKSDLFPWPLRCAERVESAQRIYLITDVLKEVVKTTSGVRAGKAFPERSDLAGKTGTTTGPRDAWFAGFNADILAVVRVGFDDDTRELGNGEQGGRTAIPAWIDFMKVALDGMPQHALPRPPGIIDRLINPRTGRIAADCNRDVMTEMFVIENQPDHESDSACYRAAPPSAGPDSAPRSNRLFQ
jgi:penicillin-binding protein 1A